MITTECSLIDLSNELEKIKKEFNLKINLRIEISGNQACIYWSDNSDKNRNQEWNLLTLGSNHAATIAGDYPAHKEIDLMSIVKRISTAKKHKQMLSSLREKWSKQEIEEMIDCLYHEDEIF